MFRYLLACVFTAGLSVMAHASTLTLEYSFNATINTNSIQCHYGSTEPKRFASECGSYATASPFEALDVGTTYAGNLSLSFGGASHDVLDASSCTIGGLNCDFRSSWLTSAPTAASLSATSGNVFMGDGWSSLSHFDFGSMTYLFMDDADTPHILSATLSDVSLFNAPAPFAVAAAPTVFVASTPLPGGLVLALAGLGAFGLLRRRQVATA